MELTPGPWFRLSNGTATGFHLSKSVLSDWANGNNYVGEIKTLQNPEANAHLIAAAPDLLEVCEEVLSLDWSPHSTDVGECMSMCPVCQTLDKLENIIKKAKGA